ncbi:Translin-like protein, partial [Drosera capensis]
KNTSSETETLKTKTVTTASLIRNTVVAIHRSLSQNPNPNLKSLIALPQFLPSHPSPPHHHRITPVRFISTSPPPMPDTSSAAASGDEVEKQFRSFRTQLEESGELGEKIRGIAMEIESVARIMHADLLLVHQSRPLVEVLEMAKGQIDVVKDKFKRLAGILQECPEQYYRYHNDWRTETQTVVSLLAFMHWLETGSLLMHAEVQEMLGLNGSDFGLDIEDYLPRYVVNQVTSGDYDCPRKVLNFITELHAAFRMLNLRNDFLRKKFDGMKYDLRKVEEVYYDVKIRGLTANGESKGDQTMGEQA